MAEQRSIGISQSDRVVYEMDTMTLACGDGYVESNDVKVYLRPRERMILDRLLAGGARGCPVPLLIQDLGLPMTAKGKGALHSHIYNLRARLALIAPGLKVSNVSRSTFYRVLPEPRFAGANASLASQ